MRKKQRQARAFSIFASIIMIFTLFTPGLTFAQSNGKISHSLNDSNVNVENKVSNSLQKELEKEEKVTFLIKFKETTDTMKVAEEAKVSAQKANLSAMNQEHAQRSAVISALKQTALESQQNVLDYLEEAEQNGQAEDVQPYFIVNGIAVTATKEVAEKIASFQEVEKILPNEKRELIRTVDIEEAPQNETASIEWSIERIGAPAVWDMGVDGQGAVVASIDTGVDWQHPALRDKYRGYDPATGEVDHTYSFFDPVNGRDVPYDDDGHGTHVTGTMVGSEPDGSNQVGVAPGAKWISVQAFTPLGAYDRDLLAAAEWILAPGGDVTKAPDVVNNSWGGGPGLNEWYRDAVTAWRASDIFPAFAAGNTTLSNPGGPGSVAVPANYPESFAVGATNSNDERATFSLLGPSPYDEIKPDIAAPGQGVRSSVPGGGYAAYNGTSMASPAVAGTVALLRSANAGLDVDTIEEVLMETADSDAGTDDQFPESPNNGYGHGIVDAFAAVSSIISGLGTIEGQVTKDGEDTTPPTYEHEAPAETYSQLDLDLSIQVSDDVSVTSVELHYGDEVLEATRTAGDFRSGEYSVTVPGEAIEEGTFTYTFVINDFGNNTVTTEEYTVNVMSGITIGYSEDFEGNNEPVGWLKTGTNNVWEWGAPTSGPGEAVSGENVYATNLAENYTGNMRAELVMPPIDMPEDGDAFLQLKSWHNFEQSSSGTNYDYGQLVISTDMENWEPIRNFYGIEDYWSSVEVDLRDYVGERIYLAYYTHSDGSVHRPGWYIDDVTLTDVSQYADDDVAPTFEHESPVETYEGMPLRLSIDVYDDLLIGDAVLHYLDDNGEFQDLETELVEDNATHGLFSVTVPSEFITGDEFTYKWTVSDYAGNEVETPEYVVTLADPITVGYSEDFEDTAVGWTSFGENDVWERGVPTSGPGEAVSGENVYATDLDANYPSRMDATLLMPAISLPEGESYLQFKSWHNFERSSSTGRDWDYGQVVISTDLEEWTELQLFGGIEETWQDANIDLSAYAGQQVYIGFYAYSDGSVVRPGWYIDDVALTDTSEGETTNMTPEEIAKYLPTETKDELEKKEAEKEAEKKASLGAEKPSKSSGKDADSASAKDGEQTAEESSGIPLAAQVSVLETNRSVSTNPQDGSYRLMHAAGEFTVVAEAYGFASEEQNVEVTADESVTANFVLDELPQGTVSGTITNERTGNPIEGATVLLAEDANVEPVVTDEDGNYELTGYEGTYTLKVVARDYQSKEVEVDLSGDVSLDIELEPFYTVPGGEIYYDDGTAENARAFYDAGNKWAVKMSLPEGRDTALVTDGVFQFHGTDWPIPGDTPFAVEVWSAGEDGMPAEKLAGPIEAEAIRDLNEWTVVDLREESIQVDGDFFMVYVQTQANPNVPGLATDESSQNAGRSYQGVGGSWSPSPASEGNYMIRARVAYGVDDPVITSPADGTVTNEAEVTVEGTASPETTLEVQQNGEVIDSVEVETDGSFAIDTELEEGANEFVAVTYIDGEDAANSETVTVTLDTEAPELAVTSPKDGEKTNRETTTVEGTVEDANLDKVTVNGRTTTVSEDGSFSQRIILDEGENVIEVVATDLAGNETTQEVTVFAKYTAPEITNLTPTEDVELQAGQSVKIEFQSEPGLRATFSIHMPLTNLGIARNVTELPMMETSPGNYVGFYTATSNVVADGAVIEVKVVDDFKNTTREQAEGKLYLNVE